MHERSVVNHLVLPWLSLPLVERVSRWKPAAVAKERYLTGGVEDEEDGIVFCVWRSNLVALPLTPGSPVFDRSFKAVQRKQLAS